MGVVAWVRFNPDALKGADGSGPLASPTPAAGGPFLPTSLFVGFTDVNGDGLVNLDEPNEPVYLDVGGDRYVTYGDIRLTAFARYGPGTAVDFTNPDFDRRLQAVPGWFQTTVEGAWFLDVDSSGNVSAGDIRMMAQGQGVKMGLAQDGLGVLLAPVQVGIPESQRVLWSDTDGDARRDPGEPLFIDLDGDRRAAQSEPQINDVGLSADAALTQADLEAALESFGNREGPFSVRGSPAETQAGGPVYAWIAFLGIMGVVTLAAIIGVGWYAYRIDRRARRAPFQQDHRAWDEPERVA